MADRVEIVRSLMPGPNDDLTDLWMPNATEAQLPAWREAAMVFFTDDVVCVFHAISDEAHHGLEGLREAWLDWLRPWETYRAEVQDVRALSETEVIIVSRDFARRPGSARELEMRGFAVYTFRGDKIARVDQFPDNHDIPAAKFGPNAAPRAK